MQLVLYIPEILLNSRTRFLQLNRGDVTNEGSDRNNHFPNIFNIGRTYALES